MNAGTYLNFHHTAEVYKKTTTTNPAGQRISSFELNHTIPIIFQSRKAQYTGGTLLRTTPYQDYIYAIEIIVPAKYSDYISLGYRIENIKDRNHNILDPGPFEIISIHHKMGFGGKKHHELVQLRYVVEQS